MTSAEIDRQTERRWRRRSNWLWLVPVVWWMLSGIYYGLTQDSQTTLSLAILPWWVLLAGMLGYVTIVLHARWGHVPVMMLTGILFLIGGGIWVLAGTYAAVTCGLVIPLIIGGGMLRAPPTTSRTGEAVLAVVLGIAEPFLVLGFALSVTMLVFINDSPLPGSGWWWLCCVLCTLVLGCSAWLRRVWLRRTTEGSAVAKTDQRVANRR